MKWIKMLVLAGAGALMLIGWGSATASATVLCQVSANPCSGEGYGEGTVLEDKLKSATEVTINMGFATAKCTESTFNSKVETPGGNTGEAVSGPVTSLTFASCSCPVTTLKNGTAEISYTEGVSGNLVSKGTELKAECSGVSCTYTTSATGTTLGKVTGGAPASLNVEASIPKTGGGFLCATNATLKGAYEVSSPSPLYVESSLLIPTVVARPVGGGAKVFFSEGEQKKTTEIEVENTDKADEAWLSKQLVDPDEKNFSIVGGTCKVPGTLGAQAICKVQIEFLTVINKTGTYTVKYGTPKIHVWTASALIESR